MERETRVGMRSRFGKPIRRRAQRLNGVLVVLRQRAERSQMFS